MPISNDKVVAHRFLADMYRDDYYPDHAVDQGKKILVTLCERIEADKPADLAALYALTHAATDEFNELVEVFYEAGSEIETVARDTIATDFLFIAHAYGFADADNEELVATRDW
ncbi:DUF5713 family protein [Nocardia jejuensis]|uniref:DUF5713 family protein n=1 Tax=Nocardia jejuensis TaxID=328049 RepID=UPI00082A79BA|nr:DUF5713 family protein [Nocardia jejuensis]